MSDSRFSQFSHRFANSATLALMHDLDQGIRQGDNACMLGGGNPAHIDTAQEVFRGAMQAICDNPALFNETFGNYSGPQGCAKNHVLLAEFLTQKLGKLIQPANLAFTNGSQSSFSILFNLFAGNHLCDNTEDPTVFKKIVLPITPEYVGYQDTNLQNYDIFESYPPKIEKRGNHRFKYRIDLSPLKLSASRHGAVCVSRPTNPSGNVISDEEMATLANACQSANVPLIIDGAYGLPFPNIVFSNATTYYDDNTILCLSLSKLGLPGMRTGIVVANEAIIQQITAANAAMSLAPNTIGPALLSQLLLMDTLDTLVTQDIQPYYFAKMQHAVSLLDTALTGLPYRLHVPEGAMFMWIWFEGLPQGSQYLYETLKEQGVYVLDGAHFFSAPTEPKTHATECIRVNYAAPDHALEKGITVIANTVKALYDAAT